MEICLVTWRIQIFESPAFLPPFKESRVVILLESLGQFKLDGPLGWGFNSEYLAPGLFGEGRSNASVPMTQRTALRSWQT